MYDCDLKMPPEHEQALLDKLAAMPPTPAEREIALAERFARKAHEAHADILKLASRISALENAIRTHRDMKWDDRCLEDDKTLYAVLGEPLPDFALPPKDEMLESCRRYIEQRGCPVAKLPPDKRTIRQLEDEVERLKAERDEYARVALVGLSGIVPTPEKGYVADGGPSQLKADFQALRKLVPARAMREPPVKVVAMEDMVVGCVLAMGEPNQYNVGQVGPAKLHEPWIGILCRNISRGGWLSYDPNGNTSDIRTKGLMSPGSTDLLRARWGLDQPGVLMAEDGS